MKSDTKHNILITLICSVVAVVIAFGIHLIASGIRQYFKECTELCRN